MKLILFLFFILFFFAELRAQYFGSIGRGDVQLLKNAQDLNGEVIDALYHGGNGRGDIQAQKNTQDLNGENSNVLYYGGVGRGDIQLPKNAQDLNGEDVSVIYYGGNGRGDVFSGITAGFADCGITFRWNGSASDEWENAANWNCNLVPGINSIVIISSGLSHYPTINNSTEIKSMELKPGSSLLLKPGVVLKVNGH